MSEIVLMDELAGSFAIKGGVEEKRGHVRDTAYWGAPYGTPLPLLRHAQEVTKDDVDKIANSWITISGKADTYFAVQRWLVDGKDHYVSKRDRPVDAPFAIGPNTVSPVTAEALTDWIIDNGHEDVLFRGLRMSEADKDLLIRRGVFHEPLGTATPNRELAEDFLVGEVQDDLHGRSPVLTESVLMILDGPTYTLPPNEVIDGRLGFPAEEHWVTGEYLIDNVKLMPYTRRDGSEYFVTVIKAYWHGKLKPLEWVRTGSPNLLHVGQNADHETILRSAGLIKSDQPSNSVAYDPSLDFRLTMCERSWDAFFDVEDKHLPGLHDQRTHGHRGIAGLSIDIANPNLRKVLKKHRVNPDKIDERWKSARTGMDTLFDLMDSQSEHWSQYDGDYEEENYPIEFASEWTQYGWQDIQKYLFTGKGGEEGHSIYGSPWRTTKENVALGDRTFESAPELPYDIVVKRAAPEWSMRDLLGGEPGTVWGSKGYTSTTMRELNDIRMMGLGGGIDVEILVPKGSTPFIPDAIDGASTEGEILLNRKSKFVLLSSVEEHMGRHYMGDPKREEITQWHVRLLQIA
jgi:hypothetical protein